MPRTNSTKTKSPRRKAGRKSRPTSQVVTTAIPRTLLPNRYKCWLRTTIEFYIPAGNMSYLAGNYMSVAVNTIYVPFNTAYVVNSAVNTYSMHGSYVQGSSGTQAPLGITMFAPLYTLYKVMRYRLTAIMGVASAADQYQAVMFPIGALEQIPSTAAAYVNLSTFLGQPGAMNTVVTNGAQQPKMVLAQETHVLLGKRKQQWLDIDSVPLASAPATNDIGYVGLFFQPLNGTTNTNPTTCSLILEQEVEFSDFIAQIL